MGLTEGISTEIGKILNTTWDSRDGRVVPRTEDVNLSNGAVKLDAVLLFADLSHSTERARTFQRSVAAKILRSQLSSMTTLINEIPGEIRSFDGDRVMGVFAGDNKNSVAATCALQMNYIVAKVLRPKAEEKLPSLREKGFAVQHCVGIASSDVLVVPGGVRGSNDLVFIGSAPNIAAKLSEIRTSPWRSYITHQVSKKLTDSSRYFDGKDMWTAVKCTLGGEKWDCYRSSWTWKP